MLKRLSKCKSFKDIYQSFGERGFSKGAGTMLKIFLVSPLIAGAINHIMLSQYGNYYDAYEYNYYFMFVSNAIFFILSIFFITYLIGKTKYKKLPFGQIFSEIKRDEFWLLFWISLLVWGFITTIASANIRGAFWGATELSSGYISHIFTLCVMGCAYLASTEQRKELIRIYIIVSDILAIIMLGYQYDIPFVSGFSAAPGCSVFTNSNHYGYYICVAALCLAGMFFLETENLQNADKRKSNIYIASFAVHMWALMINDTLGAYFGVVFGLIALMILWKVRTTKLGLKRWIPALLVVLFTFLSFVGIISSKLGSTIGPSLVVFFKDMFSVAQQSEGYEQAGTNRIALWKETIAAIKKRPILGYGPDVMYDKDKQWVISLTPHNEYLECAFFMGIPGGILYLGGLISLFISRIKKLKTLPLTMLISAGAVIAYLVSAFFGVRKYHTAPYLFMFVGFLMFKKEEESKKKKKTKKDKTK